MRGPTATQGPVKRWPQEHQHSAASREAPLAQSVVQARHLYRRTADVLRTTTEPHYPPRSFWPALLQWNWKG